MAEIGDDIDLRVKHGHVTVQQAALLRNHLSQLQSRQAQDLAEASKLKVAEDLFERDFRDLDSTILQAEAQIHALQKSMRTANAVTSRISANYGRTFSSGSSSAVGSSDQNDDDLSAKVEFSVRLGAFSARRHAYEDVVAEAREAQYFEPETGAFWRTKEIAEANQRARGALERQKRNVQSAIAYSQKSFSKKAALINPNAVGNELRARIEMIGLKADLAALNATLTRTRNLHRHLSPSLKQGKLPLGFQGVGV